MDYHSLKRKQLQELCKKHGIPANLKNVDMANRLSSLLINEEKAEDVGADENVDVEGKEDKKEETLGKALRRGKSCLKNVSDVVDSKEVKRVKFSPENQTFLFEKTDPRELRLMCRKRRAVLELREEENPVVVCANSVESQSLGVVLDDVGRGGRRNVRRKSVVVPDGGGLVGENDEKVNEGNLQRNLRSRRGKSKQESAEVVSLVSSSCVDEVENVVEERNLRRSSRRSMVVHAENLGLVTKNTDQMEKSAVKSRISDRNLRSRKGEEKQEILEVVSLVSPCSVNKVENVQGKRNSRRSMVVEALSFVTENADKVESLETLPIKTGVVEQNLRSRKGKSKLESADVALLMSPCVVNKVEDDLKGPNLRRNSRRSMAVREEDLSLVAEKADEVETLPAKREITNRNLRSRAGKANQETVEAVSLLPRSGNEHVEKPVEEGILKRSLRSRGGKSKENDAEVVPSVPVSKDNKLKRGRKGKETVEEGGDDGGNAAIDCKTQTKRGQQRKSVMAVEKVKPISVASISKQEEYHQRPTEDIVEPRSQHPFETILESKSKNRSRKKTLISKRQDFIEDSSETPNTVKADHLPGDSTADNIVSESTQPEEDESCQGAIGSFHVEEKTECFSAALPFSASGSQRLHVTYSSLPLVDLVKEKISVKEVVKSAEPIVQILASDNNSIPLSQSTDVGGNKVQEIPSLLALTDDTFQGENITLVVGNLSPSMRSMGTQIDNLTPELLEQANHCKDSESSSQPLLSEDVIFNAVERGELESKMDDNIEDLQLEAISQSGQLTVNTSLSEQVVDDNEHQTVDSTPACTLSVSQKPEVTEPHHAVEDPIPKEQSFEHMKEVTEFTPCCSLQPNLEHEATKSGECYEKGSTENAQLNSFTPAKENALTTPVMQKRNNVPSLRSMEVLDDKLTDEHFEQTSNCQTFGSSLKHLLSEDYILDTDKNVSESDEVDTKTMINFDANDELLAVKLVNECSKAKECAVEVGRNKDTKEFASGGPITEFTPSDRKESIVADATVRENTETLNVVKALDSENDMGDTMLVPSALFGDRPIVQLTDQEKVDLSMRGCDSISHESSCGIQLNEFTCIENEYRTVDSTAACTLSVSRELEVAEPFHETGDSIQTTQSVDTVAEGTPPNSGSLQLNLPHESTQSKEHGEKKGFTITTSKRAQINHLTQAKSNNFQPRRSMEVQHDIATDEHLERTINGRAFKSSIKHLFAGDFILNTDESNGTNSEEDDYAENLQGTMSVRKIPGTKLDALLGEQVSDDNERRSMDNIDANNELLVAQLVNEGSESRECTVEVGYNNYTKEFASGGLTTDSSPSTREKRNSSDASDVDISPVRLTMGEYKDQQFSSLSELDGKMMESDASESNEDLVRAPGSENEVGDMMLNVSALIDDKLTIQLTEQEEIARSMRECNSVSNGIDCGKQLNEFISVEKVAGVLKCSDEGEVHSPTTGKKSEDMETVMPLQDGDCRSQVPISESSLSTKTSFMLLPEVAEASEAVDCSSISHTIEGNLEVLSAGKEQPFSYMSEPGGRIIGNDTFDGKESCVEAPEGVYKTDDTVLEATTSFDHKFSVHLTEQEEVARAMTESDIVSTESSGAKPAEEGATEGRVLSPSSVENSENTETVTLLWDVEADCISKKPIPESDLAAETSFSLQPKVFGELAPISSSMEKGEDTSKETTSGDIAYSKNSCVDNLALVDRQPAFKLAEEAHNSIELNAQHILAEVHLINVERKRTPKPEKALTATEPNVGALGDKGLSVSSHDGKQSEPQLQFNAIDYGADINSLFTELDVMPQAAGSIQCMQEDETDDALRILFDNYMPQACNNLNHVQDDTVKSTEHVEIHHLVTSENFLYHTHDNIAGQNEMDFFGEEGILGNCVAFIADDVIFEAEEFLSSGGIETNTGESEENLGGQDVKEADVMHHAIEALEDGRGNKLCTEANSEVTDSKITHQNSNENQADDLTHTVQDDACNATYRLMVSQQTVDIEILPHSTSEVSDDGTYIHNENSHNSEAMKQYNKDQDSIDAQNVTTVDAPDDDNSKLMRRSLLIHGTPRKPVLPQHDMKENMLAPKRLQIVNATATKPMLKRKALGDI